jgi:hypothetical protein
MKAEYDFSKGERGKFYRTGALLNLPVYLEPDVDIFMRQVSLKTGKDVEKLVNEWLRSNIKLVESVQQPPHV